MGLSLPSEVILVVEDDLHKRLVFRYLRKRGLNHHAIRTEKSPPGAGSAENWVRSRFALEVQVFRRRHSQKALVAVIDADVNSVADRLAQLDRALTSTGQSPVDPATEQIARLVPKRNVETWILSLTGQIVDEASDYKRSGRDWGDLTPQAASVLAELVDSDTVLASRVVASLVSGVAELKRLAI